MANNFYLPFKDGETSGWWKSDNIWDKFALENFGLVSTIGKEIRNYPRGAGYKSTALDLDNVDSSLFPIPTVTIDLPESYRSESSIELGEDEIPTSLLYEQLKKLSDVGPVLAGDRVYSLAYSLQRVKGNDNQLTMTPWLEVFDQ